MKKLPQYLFWMAFVVTVAAVMGNSCRTMILESRIKPKCSRVATVGDCTEGDFWNGSRCAVKLESGAFARVAGPTMIGECLCNKGYGWGLSESCR